MDDAALEEAAALPESAEAMMEGDEDAEGGGDDDEARAKALREKIRAQVSENIRELAMMEDKDERLTSPLMMETAELLRSAGKIDEAKKLLLDSLEARRRVFGNDDPRTLTTINELGLLMSDQGRFFESCELLKEAVASRRKVQGDIHPETLTAMNNLAALYKRTREWSKAEPLYRETLESRRQLLGNRHPDTLTSINNLATLLQAIGEVECLQEAEPLLVEAATSAKQAKELGADSRHYAIFVKNLELLRKRLDDLEQRGYAKK